MLCAKLTFAQSNFNLRYNFDRIGTSFYNVQAEDNSYLLLGNGFVKPTYFSKGVSLSRIELNGDLETDSYYEEDTTLIFVNNLTRVTRKRGEYIVIASASSQLKAGIGKIITFDSISLQLKKVTSIDSITGYDHRIFYDDYQLLSDSTIIFDCSYIDETLAFNKINDLLFFYDFKKEMCLNSLVFKDDIGFFNYGAGKIELNKEKSSLFRFSSFNNTSTNDFHTAIFQISVAEIDFDGNVLNESILDSGRSFINTKKVLFKEDVQEYWVLTDEYRFIKECAPNPVFNNYVLESRQVLLKINLDLELASILDFGDVWYPDNRQIYNDFIVSSNNEFILCGKKSVLKDSINSIRNNSGIISSFNLDGELNWSKEYDAFEYLNSSSELLAIKEQNNEAGFVAAGEATYTLDLIAEPSWLQSWILATDENGELNSDTLSTINPQIPKSIYPNPTSGIVNNPYANASKVIISDLGSRLIEVKNLYGQESMDISNFARGTYILSFYDDNQFLGVQKIVKI